jgi:hypothetical protein
MASDRSARESATRTQADVESGDTTRHHVPRQAQRYEAGDVSAEPSGAAMGLTLAAAVLLMMSGIWNILEGIAAIVRGSFFVVLPNYAYNLSVHGWGWFHLILGIVVTVAGVGLFLDKVWARAIGVTVAAVSAMVNFLYIPYLPVWSIVLIAIDVAVIWALLTPRRRYI